VLCLNFDKNAFLGEIVHCVRINIGACGADPALNVLNCFIKVAFEWDVNNLALSSSVSPELSSILFVSLLAGHSIVFFELLTGLFVDNQFAWRFSVPGQHRAKHSETCSSTERFRQVTWVDSTSVTNNVNSVKFGGLLTLTYCGKLGVTNASLEAGCAGGSRTDSNLDNVNQTIVDKLVHAFRSYNIAGNDDSLRHLVSQLLAHSSKAVQIAICNVNSDHLNWLAEC